MSLFPSLESTKEEKIEYVKPKFYSIDYQIEHIVDKINHIDELDDNEIKEIIKRQYKLILNYDLFLSNNNRIYAQQLFSNKRFLKLFLDVSGLLDLSDNDVSCINKLAYDYYILPNKDQEVSDLLLQVSFQINSMLVVKLSAILGINASRILAMIYRSTFKEEKRIHRVNNFFIKYDKEFTTQEIINIICILFPHFGNYFTYTMLEARGQMTDQQANNFDTVSKAVIAILDSMTSNEIKIIITNYAYTIKLSKSHITSFRFSLWSLKQYPRILSITNYIDTYYSADLLLIP